ncbi:MAG: hypothetical protein IPN29_12290 [Saprospiraceae bacterium]|nr:hypothetical protein [Saprospiraceae bacterium]
MKSLSYKFVLVMMLCSICRAASATAMATPLDTLKKIIVENANNQVIDNAVSPPVRYFNGDVRAYHDGSYFFCDSAKIIENVMYAYGNVVIIQHDTISVFADELFYDGDSLFAYLRSKVVLKSNDDNLYTEYLEYDMKIKTAYYRDKALMTSGKNSLKSRKGRFDVQHNLAYFEDRVTVDGEDFHMVTDSMWYNTQSEVATWNTPATIKQDSSNLFSMTGVYDTQQKIATFKGNAQYKKGDVTAVAETMIYDGFTKAVKLINGAEYKSGTEYARADTLTYFEETKISQLVGHAYFINQTNEAEGAYISYDKTNDRFALKGKGQIKDSTQIIQAEFLDYDKLKKKGIAVGSVIWRDTAASSSIHADSLYVDGERDYMSASNKSGKPLLTTLIDKDTMFLSADTLRKSKYIITVDSLRSDTIKYFTGDNHVEIYKSDLQAVTDSLIFNEKDSVFTLFNQPLLWSDTTQLSGDTARIYLKNKKISRLELWQNGLVITSPDLQFYNQIKGNKVVGSFKDNQLDQLKVTGSAQCLYYMLDDDDGYIGVNQTECSLMIFQFQNKKIRDIRFYTEPTSTLSPMNAVDHDAIKLKGFKWEVAKRPSSPTDLLQ